MGKRDQEGILDGNGPKRRSSRSPTEDGHNSITVIPANAHILDLEELERMLAKEHHEKPRDERERLINELHGVSSRTVPESPEMIISALNLFQEALQKAVPESEKGAYHKACSMNSTYIHSAAFRLKFLRAELFDPRKAALRYVRNLDYLQEVFGDFALLRQLYLSDLNKEELKFFKKGYMQVLPFRDSVGRRIIVHLGSYGGLEFTNKMKERVGAYLNFAVLAEDETSQRKGAVSLGIMNDDATKGLQSVKLSAFNRFIQAMPIRFSGTHTCLPDNFRSKVIKALALILLRGDIRLMSRVHIGTRLEWEYSLRTFGIPTEYIPLSSTGTIKYSYQKSYFKMRSALDDHRKAQAEGDYRRYYSSASATEPFNAIECPEINAFLVRRNGAAWNYPGNIRVRDFLDERLSDRKRLQEEYVSSITKEIIARNIPILVFDDDHGWYTRVTRKEDIQKQILYIMREIRKRKRTKVSHTSNLSATDTFQGLTDERCKIADSLCDVSADVLLPMDVEEQSTDYIRSNSTDDSF